MNHKELIKRLAEQENITQAAVDSLLKKLADTVAAELHNQGEIVLHGIGTLTVVDTAARQGRNPQTGEAIEIPAGKRIKLKACKALKDAVI
jgi:DNA-binding protein HU-beta